MDETITQFVLHTTIHLTNCLQEKHSLYKGQVWQLWISFPMWTLIMEPRQELVLRVMREK